MSKHECSAIVYGDRCHSYQCTRNGAVERKSQWYCRQHDPEAVLARRNARNNKHHDERRADELINREAKRLAEQIQSDRAYAYMDWRTGRSQRFLVVPFEDIELLIQRWVK